MNIEDFDYNLPEKLIAQSPNPERDTCRLMVLNREKGTIQHLHFYDILDFLNPGDCLVMNDSKVIPARLFGVKDGTGAQVEFLLSKRVSGEDNWETLVRPGRRLKKGDSVTFGDGKLHAVITGYGDDGTRIVHFSYDGIFFERLEELGRMPLPPYIEREATECDKEQYQTVYAKYKGSVAAPTAGLHFTKELLRKAEILGVKLAYVTLHVGIGTFRPVKTEKIEEHHMHFEEYSISPENAKIINDTILNGGRIVSVGTTSTRTMESAAAKDPESGKYLVKSGHDTTGIFIYPGYEWKIVNSLITNFHLPKSTLIMLVSSFYDREKVLEAYRIAVEEKYRFFSYGDAMLLI
ncbi:MAG: tRNA preQ1(34) S-adenosylmethionine ribosyltransferase-isomerase QueA [Eubacteriales bacterium]|nr:tRNA preQ1(34) S-adenosylmethionine ribosyltransferase-isomerase QueA [Eubacteriales bacterium]